MKCEVIVLPCISDTVGDIAAYWYRRGYILGSNLRGRIVLKEWSRPVAQPRVTFIEQWTRFGRLAK